MILPPPLMLGPVDVALVSPILPKADACHVLSTAIDGRHGLSSASSYSLLTKRHGQSGTINLV